MRVVVPYTKLATETLAALPPGCTLAWVGDHERSYWALLSDLWHRGEAFIVVEHDVVPHRGALAQLASCEQEWCAFPYPMGDGLVTTALGCTKFGAGLIGRWPDLISGIPPRHRRWTDLDAIIVGRLHQHRETEHVHQPSVRHVRAVTKSARRATLRLHYTGDGTRYLHGVPAADHETDDPVTIAQALESGLYVEDTTPAPKKVKHAPAPAEAAAVSATDEVATSSEE